MESTNTMSNWGQLTRRLDAIEKRLSNIEAKQVSPNDRLIALEREIAELRHLLQSETIFSNEKLRTDLAYLVGSNQPRWRRYLRNLVNSIAQAGDLISFVLSVTALVFYLDANTPIKYPFGITIAALVFVLGMIVIWWEFPHTPTD
ncbi:hypothetical protein FBQ82_01360 [Anaerolineae bacterium CFX7]|nr:hypothetical protein [Anaerolineae bacterium CFX7]